MCGVVAKLNFSTEIAEQVLRQQIESALNLLAHRGPDYSHQYWSEQYQCGLGHTRLSIQDLSEASHQPFHYANLTMSFNGEIYNFREIREELIQLGYQFNTLGDTEVLLVAFAHWREDCFSKFNGMWAIAIWDQDSQTLTLSRDRLGVKPLYYAVNQKSFVCASEITAISAFPEIEAEFNRTYLATALKLGSVAESLPDTLISGINKFPPGYSATVDFCTREVTWKRWWYPEESVVDVGDTFEQRTDQFTSLFHDALRLRKISDAGVAIALSGGLDSGSVAVSMGEPFTAFTCDFTDARSEAGDAALIMAGLNGQHQLVRCHRPSLKHMLRCTLSLEDVSTDSHVGLDMIYQQMSAQGIKVSIEGHGGDEILAGYHHYHLCQLVSGLRLANSKQQFFATLGKFHQDTHEHVGQIMLDAMILTRENISGSEQHLSGNIGQIKVNYNTYPPASAECASHFLQTRLYNDLHFNTLPAILRNFDKLAMRHGIEIRSPFLDYRLVQFCRSLPATDLLSDGFTKRVLREAMPGLPESIRYQKRKIGFVSPFIKWCESVSQNEWRWLLHLLEKLSGLVDTEMTQRAVKKAIENGGGHDIRTHWGPICAFLFYAKYRGVISDVDLY